MVMSINSQAAAFAALRNVGLFGGRDRKVQSANDRHPSHQRSDDGHEANRRRHEPAEAEHASHVSHAHGR